MNKNIIDANYLLRYLLNDNAEQNAIATEIIENKQIVLLSEVIAEVCYVLEKVYSVSKIEISDLMIELLNYKNIIADKPLLLKALKVYGEKNIDFVDSILIAYNYCYKVNIFTFDKKINRNLN